MLDKKTAVAIVLGMQANNSVIRRYKIRMSGNRGATVTLPTEWLDDLGVKPGDKIEMSRDSENRLILEAIKREASA